MKKGTVLRAKTEAVRVLDRDANHESVQAVARDARFHFIGARDEWWAIAPSNDPRLYPWAAHPGIVEVHRDDVEVDVDDKVAATMLLQVAQRRFDLNVTPTPEKLAHVVAAIGGAFDALEQAGARNAQTARAELKEAVAFVLARDERGAEAAMNRACTAIGL